MGATSPSLLVPFVNNTSSTLTFTGVDVLTQGATGKDFAQAASGTTCITALAPAASCAVAVTFTPQHPGQRIGSVLLTGSGASGSAPLVGRGIAPQVTFSTLSANAFIPSAINPVGSGFNIPYGVATDSSGDVFVADTANNAVKEILASGGTVGSGFSYPTGVAVDAYDDVFVADAGNNAVKEILAGTGSALPGIVNSSSSVVSVGSGFNFPIGVTVDTYGNVFVGDSGNNAVKEILASGRVVSSTSSVVTVGAGFHQPYGVAVDGAGNVFVADSGNKSIKEIFAGTGGAAAGTVNSSSYVHPLGSGFSNPTAVAVDPAGNLFAADQSRNLVSELTFATPPSSLTFAATDVGVSSDPQAVILANDGTAPLTLPIPTLAGAENPSLASGFTFEDSSTCLQNGSSAASEFTVAAGSGCSMLIAFTPTTTGTTTGSLVLTNNNLNAASPTYTTQSISLTGNSNLTLPATTTTLALGSTTIYPGNSLTLTATVKDASNNPVSGATVIFSNDYAPIGSAITNSSGVATLTTTTNNFHTVGTANIMASFPGNSTVAASTSAQQQLTINISTTTTALSLSSTTISPGASLTLTATVTDASNNSITYGNVTFYNGGTQIGPAVITGGHATLTTTALHNAGTSLITAKYNGDYRDAASTSTAIQLTINNTSTTTLSLSATTITPGTSLTLTATVTNASNNPITYGAVAFYDGGAQIGIGVLNGSGVATLTSTDFHDIGATNITAKYGGSYLYAASTSTQVPLTINKIATTTQLSLSRTTLLASFPLTLTATVTDAASNPVTYGDVTFYNGGTQIGMAALNSSGVASITSTNFHDVGNTTLTAKFNGNYKEAASSGSQSLTIQ